MSEKFKLNRMELDFNNLNTMGNFRNPLQDVIDDANRRRMEQINAIESVRRKKRKKRFRDMLK